MDWGTVPAWVGSLLTGFSLLIAAITYLRSAEERRRENAENARAQAALVSSWPVNVRRWQVRNGNTVAVSVQALIDDSHLSEPVASWRRSGTRNQQARRRHRNRPIAGRR